jgi:hypothetical protein
MRLWPLFLIGLAGCGYHLSPEAQHASDCRLYADAVARQNVPTGPAIGWPSGGGLELQFPPGQGGGFYSGLVAANDQAAIRRQTYRDCMAR